MGTGLIGDRVNLHTAPGKLRQYIRAITYQANYKGSLSETAFWHQESASSRS